MTGPRLAITGLGLASALGGLITGAAAFRAGISRARTQGQFTVGLPNGDSAAIVGYAARPEMEGYERFGLWLHLAQNAYSDLLSRTTPAQGVALWQNAAVAVVLPKADGERFDFIDPPPHAQLDRWFVQPLLARLRVPPPRSLTIVADGPTGCATAMLHLAEAISSGQVQRGILLAVDSLLDRTSVEWLMSCGRLKMPGYPLGLMPGEAATWLVLEPQNSTLLPESGVLFAGAAIERCSSNPETEDPPTTRPPSLLAEHWRQCLLRLKQTWADQVPKAFDQYIDLNGEEWRALAWGHLQPHLRTLIPSETGKTWFPAEGFGDTGSAGGAVACALAVRAIQRNYTKAAHSLIWSMSDAGHSALIALADSRWSSSISASDIQD